MHRTRPCRQSLSIFWGQSVDLLASAATKNALATHAPVVQNLHVTFLASCIPALCSVLDRGWRQGLTPCARVRITTQARSPRPPCKIAPCSFLPLLPPEETDNDDDGRFNDRTGKRKQGWRSRLFCGGLPLHTCTCQQFPASSFASQAGRLLFPPLRSWGLQWQLIKEVIVAVVVETAPRFRGNGQMEWMLFVKGTLLKQRERPSCSNTGNEIEEEQRPNICMSSSCALCSTSDTPKIARGSDPLVHASSVYKGQLMTQDEFGKYLRDKSRLHKETKGHSCCENHGTLDKIFIGIKIYRKVRQSYLNLLWK